MDIDKIPLIGRFNRTLNIFMMNLIVLAIVSTVLAIAILLFPQVLTALVSIFFLLIAITFIHLAYNLHSYKQKYIKFFE